MRYKKKWYKKVLLFLFFAAALIWTLVPVYIVRSRSCWARWPLTE